MPQITILLGLENVPKRRAAGQPVTFFLMRFDAIDVSLERVLVLSRPQWEWLVLVCCDATHVLSRTGGCSCLSLSCGPVEYRRTSLGRIRPWAT